MSKLDDAKRAAAEAAQRRAGRVGTSPPEKPGPTRTVGGVTWTEPPPGLNPRGLTPKEARIAAEYRELKKRGRPVTAEARVPLTIKLTAAERAELQLAAGRAAHEDGIAEGLPLSVWAREVLLEKARKP